MLNKIILSVLVPFLGFYAQAYAVTCPANMYFDTTPGTAQYNTCACYAGTTYFGPGCVYPNVKPVVSLTAPKNNASYLSGSKITLTASASEPETGGSISQVSFYNGTNLLATVTSAPYTYTWSNVPVGSYSITAVALDPPGVQTTSSAVSITVNTAPTISMQPVNTTVTALSSATFSVVASASPSPSYQWLQSVNGGAYTNITGATSAALTIASTSLSNNGTMYKCVVSNTAGSVTSNPVTLTVNALPNFTKQPGNTTVTAPATATFSMAAIGNPAPSYQWYRATLGAGAFTVIGGATSASYTTTATTLSNNGTMYLCIATNSIGNVTSSIVTLTVNAAPAITSQPTNTSVIASATATFSVAATGNPAPSYQWYQQAPGGGSFSAISGATSASYTTAATSASKNGTKYECVVKNSIGSVTSSVVTLGVNVAPAIITQPVNKTVTAPATTTFALTATGTPTPTYQWYQEAPGAGIFTAISGATSASYTTPATGLSNNGTVYECVVSNSIGSATSNAVILTVNAAPSIITQPFNARGTAPATAIFNVVATGNPAPSYQWYQQAPGAGSFSAIAGATGSSYTTPATGISNNGIKYECVVKNSIGSVTSSVVTLTFFIAPAITTQPVNKTVTAPATATFMVSATGNPAPSYQWYQEAQGAGIFTAISGATSASYTTPVTGLSNNGTLYECVVSNDIASATSSTAILTVNAAPSITTQPINAIVTAPATATFTVSATGNPAPSYQWYQQASGAGSFTAISGATGASYTTTATALSNSGTQYECIVTNSIGKVTSSPATMTVSTVPVISTQPVNMTVTAPATATFSVAATGTPAPTYQWYQKASGASTFTAIGGATSTTYTTAATALSNNGTLYECIASNAAGSITSNTVNLSVNVAPVIVVQPASTTITAPATATFTVTATGNPAPSYQWYQQVPGAGSFTAISGATSATYTTAATALINSGTQYECILINSVGSAVSKPATMTVITVPVISTQPVSTTVTAPATATFSVTATGTPAPTYQWYQKLLGASTFTAIGGATSATYTTVATALSNSGTQFECIATNSAGSATSNQAALTVFTVPIISTQPQNMFVTAPETATFTVTASGLPLPSFQWMQELPGATSFTPISGANSASYTIASTALSNDGTLYKCVVENSQGIVTSSAATLTVVSFPVVAITSPLNNSTMTAGGNLTISATASEPGGTISSVDIVCITPALFKAVATVSSSPYSYTFPYADPGIYHCWALARDSRGKETQTGLVDITVGEVIPIVSLVSDSSKYGPSNNITLTATASRADGKMVGTITRVDFYNGTTLLGSATTSPYTYSWNNAAAGQYALTAQAYNDDGGMAVSNTVSVVVPNVYIKNVAYNVNGQITQVQYGNGVTTAYTYDPLMFRLVRIYTTNPQNQVLQDLNYAYDSIGQVLTVMDKVNTGNNSMTQSYEYDALNRLTSATGSYGSKSYVYDSIGNIKRKDGLTYNYGEPNSQVDSNGNSVGSAGPHAVTSLSDGTTIKYDLNGNMVRLQRVSNTTNYAYDSQNRLNKVTVGGLVAATYVYDGDGGRTQKTVIRRDLALYNDNVNAKLFGSVSKPLPATAGNPTTDTTISVGNLYETESGTARVTKHIYLGSTRVASVNSDGNVFYYHTDHLGGTNVISDQTSNLRELTEYDPFGQVFVHEKYGNDFATSWYYFTGKPLDDETGLIFLGARYYNPSLGRFITPDTVVQAPNNPQTLNRYSYCGNNPVNAIDPTGHSWWKKFWHSVEKVLSYVIGGVFGAPYVMAAFQGNWGMVAKGVLNTLGLLSGNPFFMISAGLSIASDNVSYYGGPKGLSQGLGYASLAFAVAGGVQMISQAFSQASIQTTSSQLGLSNSSMAPSMRGMGSDQLMGIMNNSSSGITVVDKTAAAQAEIALANGAGQSVARSFGGATGSWEVASGAGATFNAANNAATVLQVAGLGGMLIPGVGEVEGGAILLNIGGNLGAASGIAQALETGNMYQGITSVASWGIGGAVSKATEGVGTVWSNIWGSISGSVTDGGTKIYGYSHGYST